MLQKLLLCISFIFFSNNIFAQAFEKVLINDSFIKTINKYEIQIPASLYKFGCGFTPAIGSGLAFIGKDKYNNLQFFSASNSGPNFFGPKTLENENIQIFPAPEFSPYYSIIELSENDRAIVSNFISFKDLSGKNLNGLIPQNSISYKKYINVDINLTPLKNSELGINPGSISSLDENKFLWVAEGYKPSILKIDANSGKILQEISPKNLLPSILLQNQLNKGFESLTIGKDGRIFTAMSSTLDVNQKTKDKALFIRIIEFNPKNNEVKTYAYPYDFGKYNNNKDVMISDIDHISNDKFLLVEQGKNKNDKMVNNIYIIDLKNATDITNLNFDKDLQLEFASLEELTNLNIKMVEKELLFNMHDYGWKKDILNGVAIIDAKSIAIIDDNDFNFKYTVGLNNQEIDKDSIFTDYKNGSLTYNNKPLNSKIEVMKFDNIPNKLWIIELTNPLFN